MFGEKNIVGKEIIKFSSDKKVTLPKFTNAEENDELVYVRFNKYYMLLNINQYIEIISFLNRKIKDNTFLQEKNVLRSLKREVLCNTSKGLRCDKNRRIYLPIENCKEILCTGEGKHLILKPLRKKD